MSSYLDRMGTSCSYFNATYCKPKVKYPQQSLVKLMLQYVVLTEKLKYRISLLGLRVKFV